ncbi:hypothetical protein QFZ24_000823 [Streptomyces phaeochromogenes]|jgi:hypothetical protein|nr:hypothetical protein [Streptomyces phaeochromogenes]
MPKAGPVTPPSEEYPEFHPDVARTDDRLEIVITQFQVGTRAHRHLEQGWCRGSPSRGAETLRTGHVGQPDSVAFSDLGRVEN